MDSTFIPHFTRRDDIMKYLEVGKVYTKHDIYIAIKFIEKVKQTYYHILFDGKMTKLNRERFLNTLRLQLKRAGHGELIEL